MRFVAISLMFWLVGASAQAGIPIQQVVECPIGGEKFTYIDTPSCSYGYGPRNMLLWSPSSCDFVTRVPQCPENGLPLYREFSDEELSTISEFMSKDAYSDARKVSRFLLAAEIEEHLAGQPTDLGYYVLLDGLQTDPELLQSESYVRQFQVFAERVVSGEKMEAGEKPYHSTLLAYVMAMNGAKDDALEILASVRESEEIESSELLQVYVERVENCTQDKTSELCLPRSELQMPSAK